MKHTAIPETTIMDPHIRNQMSLMAWGMTVLCGWAMFLAAYAHCVCLERNHPIASAPTGHVTADPQ